MSNLHRLQWIDAQIRAGNYPNAKGLAAEFEISHRQALRDFEYLRDSLGAPLSYCAARRGYTYTTTAFTLPGPYVTGEQRSLLSSLAAYYTGVAERDPQTGVWADMAALFERLGGGTGRNEAALSLEDIQPFRAVLELPPGPQPPALQPYWRGEQTFEFTDSFAFMKAIAASWAPIRIAWPGWLRAAFSAYLEKLLACQSDMTRHVTPPLVSSDHQSSQGRKDTMTKRVVTTAEFTPSWTSYTGAAHGVLKAAGLTDLDYGTFMGLTGLAFHLIVHEECCISSVTVYDWVNEHAEALDRLGVLSEVFHAMPGSNTYEAACRRAVSNIKAALDRGVGVVLWGVDTGEFGVVTGYDDNDGVFLVDGVGKCGPGSTPILYANVGRTFEGAPMLHYQIPIEKSDFDPDKSYRSSLGYYVRHMESPFHVAPQYKAGFLAYDNWIRALEKGTYQSTGLLYNTTVYADAKRAAAGYLKFLVSAWNGIPGLAEVADRFAKIADVYQQMLRVTAHDLDQGPFAWAPVTQAQAAALLPLVREAKRLDAEALALVKAGLAATQSSIAW